MSDGDRDLPLPDSDKLEDARGAVDRAIADYIAVLAHESDDDERQNPVVLAWVVGVEWTTVALEQTNRGGRDIIAPRGQLLSASKGLGGFVHDAY